MVSSTGFPPSALIFLQRGRESTPIPEAYKVFLKVGADPEVQKLRRKVERGDTIKHVPALHLVTAMGSARQELEALKLRIEQK